MEKTGKMETPVSQQQLDASKDWNEYKALISKLESAASVSDIHVLVMNSAYSYGGLKLLFANVEGLAADFVSLQNATVAGMQQMLTPSPGRMPRPDVEKSILRSYDVLQRDFRIVDGFERLRLMDVFVEGIRERLPKSISIQRAAIQSLREQRARISSSDPVASRANLDSMEIGIQSMEDRLDLWDERDVKMGIKSPKQKPTQSDLDKSDSWQKYVLLHWKIRQAKSVEDLDNIPFRPEALKDSLSAFFEEPALVSDLMEWARFESEKKRKALNRTKAKSDTEKWNEVLSDYSELQCQFRIVMAFRTKGLDESLTRTMATPLPIRLGNQIGSAKSVVDFAKTKPADNEARIAEMETFEESVLKAYKAWGTAGKKAGQ